ncbi:serpin B3-like [Lacerta agilis]|uniref:serpin B3-like n=1 Tax=Lacerta agilis TaxID=80427 RepID=UPI0014195373|nr:serpin B3-like [Lacerta agilis]
MTTLPEANAKFAVDFFHRVAQDLTDNNVLLSPVNLISALGLSAYASGNEQAAEVEKDVPCYECEKPEGIHTAFSKILATLNEPSTNYTLSFANKLYGNKDIAFIQKFIFCALKLYLTEVDGVDLHNAPEEVRRLINLWVEIRTHGKIKDLLPKDSFDCFAQLLLVNALYFKGQWEVKFDKELTEEALFYPYHADEKDSHTVQLMHRKGVYNAGTIDLCDVQVQVLEIPYKNHELSLFVLLPVDCSAEALQQLEAGLSHEHLLDLSCDLKPVEVEVALPKFSLEKRTEIDLIDRKKGDFSGATTTENVVLTQFIHNALFEVDEEGGEEAEAVHCPKDRRPHQEPVEFRANHSFVFYVLHKHTQSILVLGRFAKPQ